MNCKIVLIEYKLYLNKKIKKQNNIFKINVK